MLVAIPAVFVVAVFYAVNRDGNISARDVLITNVTDSAFTVTWVSDEPYEGRIYYQEADKNWPLLFAQLGRDVAYDDRNVSQNDEGDYFLDEDKVRDRYTHHVTLRNLEPATDFEFRVGGLINGKNLSVDKTTTLPVLSDVSTPDPAYGRIGGTNKDDTIVILSASLSEYYGPGLLSTYVNEEGNFSIDVSYYGQENLRASDMLVRIKDETEVYPEVDFEGEFYKPFEPIDVRLL
jgi:hypothetical protein